MTRYRMRIVALGDKLFNDGVYLKSFDFEAHNGQGEAEFTKDKAAAKTFASIQEAFSYWVTVPECKPFREDGRPNKPLTATTVEFEKS
jgi:hypothetical protein